MRKALFLDREHQVVTRPCAQNCLFSLQCNDELQWGGEGRGAIDTSKFHKICWSTNELELWLAVLQLSSDFWSFLSRFLPGLLTLRVIKVRKLPARTVVRVGAFSTWKLEFSIWSIFTKLNEIYIDPIRSLCVEIATHKEFYLFLIRVWFRQCGRFGDNKLNNCAGARVFSHYDSLPTDTTVWFISP